MQGRGPTLQGQPSSDGPLDTATATSECPKGKLAFGGWSAEIAFGSGAGVATFGLQRSSKREWTVTAANANDSPGDLTSIGYCGKARKLRESRATTTVGPIAEGTATATYPRKTSVRMGGFEGQLDASDAAPAIQATAMVRTSKRTWQVTGVNVGEDDPGSLDAIAYCGKGPKLKQVAATTSVPPLADLVATATCPKRKPLAFGGFEGDVDVNDFDPIVVPHAMRRSSKRSWAATGANFSGVGGGTAPGSMTSYAYCG
ncbi:MAG: hypothetical protein ACRDMA_06490 [Solirubrobacterales bacterium]